jgi:hypothetical protein
LGIFSFVVFGFIFGGLAFSVGKLPSSGRFGLGEIGLIFAGIVLTFVLHELTHGWVMQMSGARPQYGVLWKQMMFFLCYVSWLCLPAQ